MNLYEEKKKSNLVPLLAILALSVGIWAFWDFGSERLQEARRAAFAEGCATTAMGFIIQGTGQFPPPEVYSELEYQCGKAFDELEEQKKKR